MKKRSHRMKKVYDVARQEERRSCEEMGQIQRSLDSQVDRLDELTSYRRDYARKFDGVGTVSPARWQDYQNFLTRIDQAVDAQKEQIRLGEEAREVHRRRWLVKRQRLESIERVVDRFRKAESAADERRAQKALDELTATGRFRGVDVPET